MSDLTTTITEAAYANGVPPQIALAQASKESSMDPTAYNPKSGAAGLFQLEPGTASDLGVTNPYDAQQSAQGGTAYLAQLYSEFDDWSTALAAYDWGPQNVINAQNAHGSDWLSYAPVETQDYVETILTNSGMPASSGQLEEVNSSATDFASAAADDTSSSTPIDAVMWGWLALAVGGGLAVWAVAK